MLQISNFALADENGCFVTGSCVLKATNCATYYTTPNTYSISVLFQNQVTCVSAEGVKNALVSQSTSSASFFDKRGCDTYLGQQISLFGKCE
jgi:hypothetical protein